MTGIDDEFDVERAALSLWGKSTDYGAERPHLLLQHLYDTLAVGELIWDEYLGDPMRSALDASTAGRGRQFFAFARGGHPQLPNPSAEADGSSPRTRGSSGQTDFLVVWRSFS